MRHFCLRHNSLAFYFVCFCIIMHLLAAGFRMFWHADGEGQDHLVSLRVLNCEFYIKLPKNLVIVNLKLLIKQLFGLTTERDVSILTIWFGYIPKQSPSNFTLPQHCSRELFYCTVEVHSNVALHHCTLLVNCSTAVYSCTKAMHSTCALF